MDKKEFLDVSREYFKSIGFQTLKKSKFYCDTEDITFRVWLMHSNFGEYFYVDYDVRVKPLHTELINHFNDTIWDSLIAGRLVYDKDKSCTFEYNLLNQNIYLDILKKATETQILPIIVGGVQYLKKVLKRPTREEEMQFHKDTVHKLLKL